MFQVMMRCDPWDLVQEGIDEVLDRIKGEASVTGLTLPLLAPATVELRTHGADVCLYRSSGGAAFQPDPVHYAGTRMRPPTADWIRKSNPLNAILAATRKRSLTAHARLVVCDNPLLVERYPFAAAKTVFGDPHPARLCPINPDVREMLRGICDELLTAYQLDGIEVEELSLPPTGALERRLTIASSLGEVASWLLNTCFCESCRQLAARDALDVTGAAETARSELNALLADEEGSNSLREWLAEHPLLETYAAWQHRQIADTVSALVQICKGKLSQAISADAPPSACGTASSSNAPGLIVKCPWTDAPDVIRAMERAEEMDCPPQRLAVEVSAVTPGCADSDALVRALHEAATRGLHAAIVGTYGRMPMGRLEWVHRAARYASREARS